MSSNYNQHLDQSELRHRNGPSSPEASTMTKTLLNIDDTPLPPVKSTVVGGSHEAPKPPLWAVSKNLTGAQVAKAESKVRKIMVRTISGACMIGTFLGTMYMGHLYLCALVALVELLLFRELVRVRYNALFNTIQDTIPLFRTTQWLWFTVAIIYTYGDFIAEVIQNNDEMHYLLQYSHYFGALSFLLYSGTFVLTIGTIQAGHVRFQLNQLCWTILVLCLTVGQLKYIMHNIFNGLIWFALPILLVVTNDIMAYVAGMTWGRKFIQRPFISFSPNKTWEGFIGGGICTFFLSWFISRWLAQYKWMTCPTNQFTLSPAYLDCNSDPLFVRAQIQVPSQVLDVLPRSISKIIPGVNEICTLKSAAAAVLDNAPPTTTSSLLLTPCISGDPTLAHHHFELWLKDFYPIQIHALWLAVFASVVAPFGGFFASAIKRAYGLKDFDSLIPGHGGVMDRMDCQLLMALCTWVHYNTFVKISTLSVAKLKYLYSMLNEADQIEFLAQIVDVKSNARGNNQGFF